MARMSPQNEREFEALAAYVCLFATVVWRVPESAPHHPVHHMGIVPGQISKSQRLAGLRQAANDTVESSEDFTPEQVSAFDAICRSKGVITLTEIRRRYWKKYKALIKRGRLRDETEYYLAVGLLNDLAAEISPAEREKLQSLVSEFERRIAQSGTHAGGSTPGRSAS
ncbi:hypothetical protein [Solimonas variicoloris]|uniref:hypothetical protein n=1 Tax=Solimonas variicoloris TaxID=254408 RepID=UPI0003787FE9|nr:hypothetical protein [Solimonas variicoloris]